MTEIKQIRLREDFGQVLKELGLKGNGIEIGVLLGDFSEVILKTTELSKVYLLDSWKYFPPEEYKDCANKCQVEQDENYARVLKRVEEYGKRVEVIRGDSRAEFSKFEDGFFDFVYVDANHEYPYVKQDLVNWYPKVKVGGIFAGHDYRNAIKRFCVFGVKQAVDEFCLEKNLKLMLTQERRRKGEKSWYFQKDK